MFNQKNGFSIIEAMASIAIISIGIVAAAGLLSKGLGESIGSKNQSVAALLAQEGIELVRNLRDTNWIGGTEGSFDNTITGFPANDAANCAVYYNSTSIVCPPDPIVAGNYLKLDINKFYTASDNLTGRFQRKIIISYDTGSNTTANEAVVTSAVVWGGIFPPAAIDDSSCNTTSKCSYAKTTLSRWRR